MPSRFLQRLHACDHQPERVALLLVVLVHALLLTLWLYRQVPVTPDIKLMSVRMLSPAPVAPSVRPKAQVTPKQPVVPIKPKPPVTRVNTPLPAAMPVPVAEAKPVPVAPVAVAPVVEPAPPAPAPPAPVEATLPPRFDAAYLDNPSPRYPPLSRKLAEQGRVLLRVMVAANGRAVTVQLERSSGYARLDDAAVAAVSSWRFVPARQGTQAVSATVLVPIVFSLTR